MGNLLARFALRRYFFVLAVMGHIGKGTGQGRAQNLSEVGGRGTVWRWFAGAGSFFGHFPLRFWKIPAPAQKERGLPRKENNLPFPPPPLRTSLVPVYQQKR